MSPTEYFSKYKYFIFSGSGGTGKTTLSAAWAKEALALKKNIALITIDPSRRLGDEFGMDVLKQSFHRYQEGEFFIDVYLIHSQEIIKDFLKNNYSEEFCQELADNKLFNQVSTTLSENQSVSTIYKLSQVIKDSNYDMVVVDTPPAGHTIDFFRSPRQVIKIFEANLIAKTAMEAKNFSIFSGSKIFRKILSYLTGKAFVKEMEIFFVALFAFQEHIIKAAQELEALIKSKDVCYFLVSQPEVYKLRESTQILKELKQQGIIVQNVIINRAYPNWLNVKSLIEEFKDSTKDLALYYKEIWSYYNTRYQVTDKELMSYDKNLKTYFLPEASFFDEDYSISNVQKFLREYIQ